MSQRDDTPGLSRDPRGRLVLGASAAEPGEVVVPVRAFPLDAPDEGISLQGSDGRERLWIDSLDQLPASQRQLLEDEFAKREFIPVILSLARVSTFATPSTWTVVTDRGDTEFVLRGEEDIRNIGRGRLLVTDSHGIQYLIPELAALDRHSRRLLDRFL